MADQVHTPQEAPRPASEPSGGAGAPQFGLTAAMALIVGSIIGVGVFNLPTSLASYGPITLVSMALTTVGALALAMLFAVRMALTLAGPHLLHVISTRSPYDLQTIRAWSECLMPWSRGERLRCDRGSCCCGRCSYGLYLCEPQQSRPRHS